MKLDNNTFANGVSETKGGALNYLYMKPQNITTNKFTNNTAVNYSNDISSHPVKLKRITEEYYLQNYNTTGDVLTTSENFETTNTVPLHRSGANLPAIYIGLFNEFDTLVKTSEDTLFLELPQKSNEKYISFVNGNFTFVSTNGVFNVSGIQLTATPGTTQTPTFSTNAIDESIPYVSDYLKQNSLANADFELTVKVRECQVGEELKDNGVCFP